MASNGLSWKFLRACPVYRSGLGAIAVVSLLLVILTVLLPIPVWARGMGIIGVISIASAAIERWTTYMNDRLVTVRILSRRR